MIMRPNNRKRVFVVFLLCFFSLIRASSSGKAESFLEREGIALVEAKPYPGRDPAMWDGVYAARNGMVYSGLISESVGAHFYVYDPDSGENRLIADIAEVEGTRGKGVRTSGKIHNKPVEDSRGNIYFATMNNGSGPRNIDFLSYEGGHWFRYDPSRDTLEDLGIFDRGVGPYPIGIDPIRMVLYGIGFNSYLYRFDIEKGRTTNLGRVSNWDICRDIFLDDQGNVYGSFPVGRVWKHNPESGLTQNLSIRVPYDQTIFPTQLSNPMIDRTMDWRAIEWDSQEKVAYGVTCGSGSILFRFNPHGGTEGDIDGLTRICDPKFWNTDRRDIPYSTLAFAVDSRNQRVYFVPSAREYAVEDYVETFGSDERHHLIMYDIARGRRVDIGEMQTRDGRSVFGCEGASVAPDGTLYIVGQVEVKNRHDATRQIGEIPVALHLIIYRPDQEQLSFD